MTLDPGTLTLPSMPPPHGFDLCRRKPPPGLAGMVDDIVGYRETVPGAFRQIETASLAVPLIVSFGEPWEIALGRTPGRDDRIASFAAGLCSGPVVIHSFGGAHCLQINFTPLGAFRFFGLPMHELAARMVPLDDLPRRPFSDFAARLADASDWERRFDIAEAFLARRINAGQSASDAVAWAYGRILRSGGRARIDAIARTLEWSRKHLAYRFRFEIGLGPKAVARIVRFNRATGLAQDGQKTDWADVAAACGYADQAHLVREFRELAGTTPAKWRRWPDRSGG